jgi:large conductance mechanosensitive channel
MVNDFKEFLLRGNVVDLAVAVVIGTAFGAVVTAFVADLVTPLIGAIGGQPDFSALDFTINDSTFRYGDFINNLLSFLIIAAVIFFFVVVPINKLMEARKTEKPIDTTIKECPFCLSSIPAAAKRCAFCTSEV